MLTIFFQCCLIFAVESDKSLVKQTIVKDLSPFWSFGFFLFIIMYVHMPVGCRIVVVIVVSSSSFVNNEIVE